MTLPVQRLHLSQQAFADETAQVKMLLGHTERFDVVGSAIIARASSYAERLRNQRGNHASLEGFLQEYGLNTKEGIALMCLAEALLRIPDIATADALIRDKFKGTDWKHHLGQSPSLWVNASSWGMLLTGSVIHWQEAEGGITSLFGRLSEPVIRAALKKAMQLIGSQFIIGKTVEDSLKYSKPYVTQGYVFSYDMLGEGARSFAQADGFFHSYLHAIHVLGNATQKSMLLFDKPSISIKLSALHPRYELTGSKRLLEELLPKLETLVEAAAGHHLAVTIDAEESSRLDVSLLLFEALLQRKTLQGFEGIGLAVQAYQKRAWYVLEYLQMLAEHHRTRIPVRLVKGAYWDTEIKLAQQLGLTSYPVFTQKHHTDISYLACAGQLLDHPKCFYPQFATHNAHTVSALLEVVDKREFEFQRLHGMGEALYAHVLQDNPAIKCRIYAPVGKHKELLPYLIRRMLENGSSTSFIHQLGDNAIPVENLIEDPVGRTKHLDAQPNPAIVLPERMYKTEGKENDGSVPRQNSQGFDLGNLAHLHEWETALGILPELLAQAIPPVTEITIESALSTAAAAFPAWGHSSACERALLLERAADLLAVNRNEMVALCIHEAGKTLSDAIAELREAVDFCRYYAALLRTQFSEHVLQGPTGEYNALTLHGRGVFLCISPWNFPLAIFTGQVAAALAAGNCVIAKPAGQTPRIAAFAIKLLHEAGVPAEILHYVPASGTLTGEKLVPDLRISGIAFTGSTVTARRINQALAAREGAIIPFIAETGGQNTMIVDSTALLEAAVDDIVMSAFNSAGQRCSALRVLYIQEDIADTLITLLKGAMEALVVGDPSDIATHIGPVIDQDAKEKLLKHISYLHGISKCIAKAPAPEENDYANFVIPHAFEIASIRQLPEEVFGPVLHVIRFAIKDLDKVVVEINSTGYGLTFGVHSRVEERIQYLRKHIRAGNMYVNRNMIGAVVGVQPFGGEGLSGTGPKAGGPHYLARFAHERSFTNNIAAIGGNIPLMNEDVS